jgi:hypothetical protein
LVSTCMCRTFCGELRCRACIHRRTIYDTAELSRSPLWCCERTGAVVRAQPLYIPHLGSGDKCFESPLWARRGHRGIAGPWQPAPPAGQTPAGLRRAPPAPLCHAT